MRFFKKNTEEFFWLTPSNSGYVGYVWDTNRTRNMGQVGDFMRNHLMGYGWDMNNRQQMGHERDILLNT